MDFVIQRMLLHILGYPIDTCKLFYYMFGFPICPPGPPIPPPTPGPSCSMLPPPPPYSPSLQPTTFAVDGRALKPCIHKFTYIWLENGEEFWMYPTYVGRRSISGCRWNSRCYRWDYFGIDLDNIESFVCY